MSSIKNQALQESRRDALRTSGGSTGHAEWALAIGKITEVSYEDSRVFVEIIGKESDRRDARPIPITYAFGGRRSILGGMPEKGDLCVVGQMADESYAGSRQPIILSYFSSSGWVGHDYVSTSDLSGIEGMATPDQRANLNGAFDRIRQKLRHYDPGNIFGSSSQGSDFVLDESVTLSNRRGSEFILRDSDETMVSRSVAGMDAFSGVRLYKGPVSRTANILNTQMFSDGLLWETLNQVQPEESEPITQQFLIENSGGIGSFSDTYAPAVPEGYLTPSYLFLREDGVNAFEVETDSTIPQNLDPYQFLSWGSFCTPEGLRTSPIPDAVYGGRVINRVGLSDDNQVLNAALGGESLTEFRIEINHTTDQTLPVTEQTDSIDADRLPSEPIGILQTEGSPFIEFVFGSVVGNDPYSEEGQILYGQPLAFQLFEGDDPAPKITSAVGADIGNHLSFLFRMTPVSTESTGDTVFAFDKAGSIKMVSQGDPQNPFNIQLHSNTGLLLSSNGILKLRGAGGFEFASGVNPNGYGLDFASEGGIRIKATGPIQEGSQQGQQPDLLLEGKDRTAVRASSAVEIEAPRVSARNANLIELQALTTVQVQAGEAVTQSSKTYSRTTTGKSTEVFGGPIDGLIINGPVREISVIANPATGFVGGTNDKYQNIYGDREETFLLGNHTTQCVVGNLTYSTAAGTVTARSLTNQTQWSPAGVISTATVGNISETATAGAITNQSTISSLYKTTGSMTVSGAAVLLLGGPGKVGPVVCGSDLDPLTGLPLISLGMGSPGHILVTPS